MVHEAGIITMFTEIRVYIYIYIYIYIYPLALQPIEDQDPQLTAKRWKRKIFKHRDSINFVNHGHKAQKVFFFKYQHHPRTN